MSVVARLAARGAADRSPSLRRKDQLYAGKINPREKRTGVIMNVRLVAPEELQGIIPYRDAISVVETAFREWGKNPVFNNPRQRTHTPDGVRVSIHHGAAPFLGMTGYMSHCELL